MGRKAKLKPEQVIAALQEFSGLQAAAAAKLKVSRSTIANYIEKYDDVKAAYTDVNESTIDRVESRLLKEIDKGNITAIIFYLKTKARHRGYLERYDVTSGDKPIAPTVIEVIKSGEPKE